MTGPVFFSDHSFASDTYTSAADAYDSVIERCIGMHDYGNEELKSINEEACKNMAVSTYQSPEQAFKTFMMIEKLLCQSLAEEMKGASEGTKNLLAQLADDSEVRQYKLKQRLQK
jgi:DNA-binding ferritin-like protein